MPWKRGKAYGQDIKERFFAASDKGARVGVIPKMLIASTSDVSKTLGRRRDAGETPTRPLRCHVPPKLKAYRGAYRLRIILSKARASKAPRSNAARA